MLDDAGGNYRWVSFAMMLVGAMLGVAMLFFAQGEGTEILAWGGGLLSGAGYVLWAMDDGS